ncbi:MAG: hypothetical protein AAF747_01250 [Planctomycetota bacterium]
MSDSPVIIRDARRFEIALRARFRINSAAAEAVRLTPSAGATSGWLEAQTTDVSRGGIGLVTPLYLPRGCCIDVEVFHLHARDGDTPLVRTTVEVRRVQMTDSRPAYMIGTATVADDDTGEQQMRMLIERLGAEGAA